MTEQELQQNHQAFNRIRRFLDFCVPDKYALFCKGKLVGIYDEEKAIEVIANVLRFRRYYLQKIDGTKNWYDDNHIIPY